MMRYTLKEILYQLRNPVGRYELLLGQFHNLWPLLRWIAAGYRKSILQRTRVIAVVGSLGKSTTMRAITAALGLPVPQVPPGNSWNMLATSLLSIRPGARYGVLEVGVSSPGWMGKYAGMICPDVAVVTSIASEHHSSPGPFIDK